MSGDFFDTNVLLYLLSEDAEKADRAEARCAGRRDQRAGPERSGQRHARASSA